MTTITIDKKVYDGRNVPLYIRQQPGYAADGGIYKVSKTKTGGRRLYKLVSGQWMDASLKDI